MESNLTKNIMYTSVSNKILLYPLPHSYLHFALLRGDSQSKPWTGTSTDLYYIMVRTETARTDVKDFE